MGWPVQNGGAAGALGDDGRQHGRAALALAGTTGGAAAAVR